MAPLLEARRTEGDNSAQCQQRKQKISRSFQQHEPGAGDLPPDHDRAGRVRPAHAVPRDHARRDDESQNREREANMTRDRRRNPSPIEQGPGHQQHDRADNQQLDAECGRAPPLPGLRDLSRRRIRARDRPPLRIANDDVVGAGGGARFEREPNGNGDDRSRDGERIGASRLARAWQRHLGDHCCHATLRRGRIGHRRNTGEPQPRGAGRKKQRVRTRQTVGRELPGTAGPRDRTSLRRINGERVPLQPEARVQGGDTVEQLANGGGIA